MLEIEEQTSSGGSRGGDRQCQFNLSLQNEALKKKG